MTPKQKNTLQQFGVDVSGLTGISIKEASDLIETAYESRKAASRDAAERARDYPLTDLVGYHKSQWRSYSLRNASGKCPLCSKSDKADDKSDSFSINLTKNEGMCRLCGWAGGPIQFVMERDGLSWHEAARKIVNEEAVGREVEWVVRQKVKDLSERIAAFDRKWRQVIKYGQQCLPYSKTMTYLNRRGLDYETCRAFGVGHTDRGYGPYLGQACALFPYYTSDSKLCAVNRRVSREVPHDKSWFASGAIKTGYFGVRGFSNLTWVIEGEINAMSVHACLTWLGRSDSVVSLSSQDDLVRRADEIRRNFEQVIVWCDEKEIEKQLRGADLAAWSTKQDANDLWLAGQLANCIDWMLARL